MDSLITASIGFVSSIIALFVGRFWGLKDHQVEHDKKILHSILETIPSNGSIEYIREASFSGLFDPARLRDLNHFEEVFNRPEYHFIDKEIEKKNCDLFRSIDEFRNNIGQYTFPENSIGERWNRMMQEHEFENPDEYLRISGLLEGGADNVYKSFDELIVTARKRNVYL